MLRKLIEGLRILLCSCQKEDDGLLVAYGIDGETESGIIGKRRVYYYHIKIPFSNCPLGGADVGNKLDGRKNGGGKDLRQSLIEFFGRRNDQNTVDLFSQAQTDPPFTGLFTDHSAQYISKISAGICALIKQSFFAMVFASASVSGSFASSETVSASALNRLMSTGFGSSVCF